MPYGQLGLPSGFGAWMEKLGYGGGAGGILEAAGISADPEYLTGLQSILRRGGTAFGEIPSGLGGLQEQRRMGRIGLQREAVGVGGAARGALGRSGFAGAGAITAGLTSGRREREQRYGGILGGYREGARSHISSELDRIFEAMGIEPYLRDLLGRGAREYEPPVDPLGVYQPGTEQQDRAWDEYMKYLTEYRATHDDPEAPGYGEALPFDDWLQQWGVGAGG